MSLQNGEARTETAEIMRHHLKMLSADDIADMAAMESERPVTRADCKGGIRPCPWASCKFNLAIEVNPLTGNIKHCEADLELNSCQLDVIERNPDGLAERQLADVLGITHQRISQLILSGARAIYEGGSLLATSGHFSLDPIDCEGESVLPSAISNHARLSF